MTKPTDTTTTISENSQSDSSKQQDLSTTASPTNGTETSERHLDEAEGGESSNKTRVSESTTSSNGAEGEDNGDATTTTVIPDNYGVDEKNFTDKFEYYRSIVQAVDRLLPSTKWPLQNTWTFG